MLKKNSLSVLATRRAGENFDEFVAALGAVAFVERTRKNLEELKQPWTRQTEGVVRRAATGRWRDIQMVLAAAPAR